MQYPVPVVRSMATIVSAVETAILPTIQGVDGNIIAVNYQFGHLKEIVETLAQQDRASIEKYKKYPLVALFLDFPEHFGNAGGYPGECTLQMAICYPTEPTLKTDEHYANSIKPILLPIYYELMRQIDGSGFFITYSERHIQHLMTEHPYGSKSDMTDGYGNMLADYVDCLFIREMKLKYNFPNCLK